MAEFDKRPGNTLATLARATQAVVLLTVGAGLGNQFGMHRGATEADSAKNKTELINGLDYSRAETALKSHRTLGEALLGMQAFLGGAGQHGRSEDHRKFFSELAIKMDAEAAYWNSKGEQKEVANNFSEIARKLESLAKGPLSADIVHKVVDSCQATQQGLLKLFRP